MTAPRIAQADALVTRIRAMLDTAGLETAHVTTNALEVASAARHGVVVVSPPTLTFETWDDATAEWELHAIAGPSNNYLAAWETLDGLIEALREGELNLKRAEPGSYEPLRGEPLPAYTITLNPID